MTREERRNPDIINGSRRKRIARGSGTSVEEINQLIKQFGEMRTMMRQMSSGKGPWAQLARQYGGAWPACCTPARWRQENGQGRTQRKT